MTLAEMEWSGWSTSRMEEAEDERPPVRRGLTAHGLAWMLPERGCAMCKQEGAECGKVRDPARLGRPEMDVRLLLARCEALARGAGEDWRLRTYVASLQRMLRDLSSARPSNAGKEGMAERLLDYTKRVAFLTGLVQTSTLSNPIEKLEAVQQLSHGSATACANSPTHEIHQKTVAKYGMELRSDLFGLDNDDTLRQRNIIKAPNFTSNGTGQEDMDTLLKYHQNMQEKVAENMVMLTKSLKEQSQIASTIIRKDTEALKKSSDLTDRNIGALKVESEKLQEHSRGAWKCWLWIMLAVVMIIFINMVLFMKVMKKKKY